MSQGTGVLFLSYFLLLLLNNREEELLKMSPGLINASGISRKIMNCFVFGIFHVVSLKLTYLRTLFRMALTTDWEAGQIGQGEVRLRDVVVSTAGNDEVQGESQGRDALAHTEGGLGRFDRI